MVQFAQTTSPLAVRWCVFIVPLFTIADEVTLLIEAFVDVNAVMVAAGLVNEDDAVAVVAVSVVNSPEAPMIVVASTVVDVKSVMVAIGDVIPT
jgi:hypothetical protein